MVSKDRKTLYNYIIVFGTSIMKRIPLCHAGIVLDIAVDLATTLQNTFAEMRDTINSILTD